MAIPLPFPEKFIIGVVHLKPLPGSPHYAGGVEKAAIKDAKALADGGVHGLIVENFGDAPFFPGRVEPHTVAVMTALCREIQSAVDLPIGVNVLRNDGHAALGIACACNAAFVRVNVFTGAAVTDQGVIQGEAHSLLRYRRAIDAKCAILADVHVKHATPLGSGSIVDAAKDTCHRCGADAVIVTGSATGSGVDLEELRLVREALPDTTVIAGSGVTDRNVKDVLALADGAIVGTWFKRGGKVAAPVESKRVFKFMKLLA
jgi:membrane complex biogenesis BtpA family protein